MPTPKETDVGIAGTGLGVLRRPKRTAAACSGPPLRVSCNGARPGGTIKHSNFGERAGARNGWRSSGASLGALGRAGGLGDTVAPFASERLDEVDRRSIKYAVCSQKIDTTANASFYFIFVTVTPSV